MTQPKQELVCVCGAVWEGQELMEALPQRTWVGLTYEEQEEIVLSAHSIRDAINKTDWKLKEKNT